MQGLSKCLTIVPKSKIKNHCLVAKFENKKTRRILQRKILGCHGVFKNRTLKCRSQIHRAKLENTFLGSSDFAFDLSLNFFCLIH